MPYGTIKVDTITFTAGGVDTNVSISGLVQNPTFSGNITTTGNITGANVIGTTTVSGATVTGTTGNFAGTITAATVVGTTTVSGATVTGNTGSFTTLTGGVTTITSGVFATGTAALPSISFTSDPNTGIYSPGADQVAISTNGTGRLFVDASGNVSIGSAVADSVGSTFSLNVDRSAGNGQLSVSANGTVRGRMFADNSTGEFRIGNPTANPLLLYTSNTERLRITSDGKVGLGTSSPQAILDVAPDANRSLLVQGKAATTYGLELKNGSANSAGEFHVTAASSGSVVINRGSTEIARFNSTGLGIGTTSPGAKLEVSTGSIDIYENIRLYNRSSSNHTRWGITCNHGDNTKADVEVFKGVSLSDNTSNQVALGGGTAGSGKCGLSSIVFVTTATPGTAETASERARIDSSGRLLVGTSSSRSGWFNNSPWGNPTLQVEGTSVFNSGISVTNNSNDDNGSQIILGKSRATSVGGVTVVSSGDNVGRISFQGADGTELVAAATIEAAVDGTPGNNDMPGRLVFSTTADGASSPTERMRITQDAYVRLASGTGGIQFNGDTAAANALDDYEEGTWTPAVPGTSMTYNAQIGVYTKVGNLVYIRCYVNISGGTPSGGGGGGTIITGLPFTSESTQYHTLTTSTNGGNFGGTVPIGQVVPGTTTISAIGVTNDAGFVDSVPTSVWDAANNWVQVTGCYRVP